MKLSVSRSDYSTLQAANQALTASKASKYNVNRAELQYKQLGLNKSYTETQNALSIANSAIGVIGQGIQIAQLVQDSQKTKAQNQLVATQAEATKRYNESLLNGTTTWVQDSDGSAKLQLAPEIETWKKEQLSAIDSSKDFKAVKDWHRGQLNSMFADLDVQAYGNAAERAYSDLNEAFVQTLSLAQKSDVANSVTSGKRSYETGLAAINGRADWSDVRKATTLSKYQQTVDLDADTQIANRIVQKNGLAAATEYLYGLTGYTPTEVQGMVDTIKKTDLQLTDSATNEAEAMMSQGLRQGAPPSDLYNALSASTENMPQNRKEASYQAARATHIDFATQQGIARFNNDKAGGLLRLEQGRTAIAEGEGTYLYSEIPDTQRAIISLYDSAISTATTTGTKAGDQDQKDFNSLTNSIVNNAKAGAVTFEDALTSLGTFKAEALTDPQKLEQYTKALASISELKTKEDKANQTEADNDYKQFETDVENMTKTITFQVSAGTITGHEAIAALNGYAQYAKTVGSSKGERTVQDALSKIYDELIDDATQAKIDTAYKTLENTLGIDTKKMTPEQAKEINDYKDFIRGAVVDLFCRKKRNEVTDSELNDMLLDLQRNFTTKALDATMFGTALKQGVTINSQLKSALNVFDELSKHSDDTKILYKDAKSGTIRWATEGYEKSFDTAANTIAFALKDMGYDISEYRPMEQNGELSPLPVFQAGKDGFLTVKDGGIYQLNNGYWDFLKRLELGRTSPNPTESYEVVAGKTTGGKSAKTAMITNAVSNLGAY